jgi:nucleotidyltransferase substrate binding protein (TIGR01987 family)
MDRLKERIDIARKAVGTLRDALREPPTAISRDASIQRFEYTFETTWKAVQAWLAVHENLELASPNSVIRAAHQVGMLTETQARAALLMARDRNLTSHTYNEELADQVYSRLPAHADLVDRWLSAMDAAGRLE